jgi:hypothetical protein
MITLQLYYAGVVVVYYYQYQYPTHFFCTGSYKVQVLVHVRHSVHKDALQSPRLQVCTTALQFASTDDEKCHMTLYIHLLSKSGGG